MQPLLRQAPPGSQRSSTWAPSTTWPAGFSPLPHLAHLQPCVGHALADRHSPIQLIWLTDLRAAGRGAGNILKEHLSSKSVQRRLQLIIPWAYGTPKTTSVFWLLLEIRLRGQPIAKVHEVDWSWCKTLWVWWFAPLWEGGTSISNNHSPPFMSHLLEGGINTFIISFSSHRSNSTTNFRSKLFCAI